MRRLLLFGVLIAAGACGSSTSNSGPSGMNAQVGFTWLGTVTQTTAGPNGAVCLLSFQGANGTADSWTIQMTQNDTAVTAVAVSNNSGQTCNYTGTVGPSALTLNMTACSPPGLPAHVRRCLPGNPHALGYGQRHGDSGHDGRVLERLRHWRHDDHPEHDHDDRQLHLPALSAGGLAGPTCLRPAPARPRACDRATPGTAPCRCRRRA